MLQKLYALEVSLSVKIIQMQTGGIKLASEAYEWAQPMIHVEITKSEALISAVEYQHCEGCLEGGEGVKKLVLAPSISMGEFFYSHF